MPRVRWLMRGMLACVRKGRHHADPCLPAAITGPQRARGTTGDPADREAGAPRRDRVRVLSPRGDDTGGPDRAGGGPRALLREPPRPALPPRGLPGGLLPALGGPQPLLRLLPCVRP